MGKYSHRDARCDNGEIYNDDLFKIDQLKFEAHTIEEILHTWGGNIKNPDPHLYTKTCRIKGQSLFCNFGLSTNSVFTIYFGKFVSITEGDRREKLYGGIEVKN